MAELSPTDALALAKAGAVIGCLLLSIISVAGVFRRLDKKQQGFGPSSLRALGISIFLPLLVLVILVLDLSNEVVAALLGTVAGYLLSSDSREQA